MEGQEDRMEDLLTILVTTSPIPSAPSPALIGNTLSSLPVSVASCKVIISFDAAATQAAEGDHLGKLKRGRIPKHILDSYPAYIDNVKDLYQMDAGSSFDEEERETCFVSQSTDHQVLFLRQKKRLGFGFTIKSCLEFVQTKYVMVVQHDWLFTKPDPPLHDLLKILQVEVEVKYISFIARMSVGYEKSRGHSHHYYRYIFEKARALRQGRPFELVSCLHWFDRPHLTSVAIYREIFSLRPPIMKRGDFLEDTFGTHYLSTITNARDAETSFQCWLRWGAWLYYPDNGEIVGVKHSAGRVDLQGERQEEKIRNYIKANQQMHQQKETVSQHDWGSHWDDEEPFANFDVIDTSNTTIEGSN